MLSQIKIEVATARARRSEVRLVLRTVIFLKQYRPATLPEICEEYSGDKNENKRLTSKSKIIFAKLIVK